MGSRRLAGLLVAPVLALALAGCTDAVAGAPAATDIGPLTTAQAAAQSLVDFGEASAVHYKGTLLAADGAEMSVELDALPTGEVAGTVTVDDLPATVTVVGDTLYLKGDGPFWSALSARFGVAGGDGGALAGRWVKLPTSLVGVEFGEVFLPDVLGQAAGSVTEQDGSADLTRTPKKTVAGGEAYVVDVEGGTLYLATAAPHGVLRLELDQVGGTENTAVSDVALDVADASPRASTLYRDLNRRGSTELTSAVDALTGIEQGAHRFEACGAPSCSLVVDIRNTGKSAVRVHLRADWTGDDTPLGSCEAKVGPMAPGANGTIGCTIATPEWVSFYQRANSVPGTHPYGAQWSALVLADPPDVAELKSLADAKPAAADGSRTEGSHAVYQISSAGTVWKYGVVATRYLREHVDDQLRGCLAATRSACSGSPVTVADNPASAHALVAQLVTAFRTESGSCPAGQWVGCTGAA